MSELALDYVSPLPPVRSGIADYSADLLPHLESLCDLRVVRLPDQPVSESVAERWRPVSSERLGEGDRVALYHMGNNRYHVAVEALAMRTPGILVLHDFVLHHFLIGETVGKGDLDAYRRRLAASHGWQGEAVATAIRWGAFSDSLQFGLPAHGRLVRRQRGILVHSHWAREVLTEENPGVEVRTVPMAIPLPERGGAGAGVDFRRRLGIPEDSPLLGTFGFQTPMKRPEVAVKAMSRPGLSDAHLVIAGEVAETLDLEEVIGEAGVGERVHVTGFLDYADFEAAISACDLALNLRYPSAGETSAALLRVLALGRPTLVSEYAQFAELPEDVAIKVPVGEGEVEAIAARSAELLGEPGRLARMGNAARDYVRSRHDPAASAAAMVEACNDMATCGPQRRRSAAPASPTTLTASTLDGELEVSGHEREWEEGARRRLALRLRNLGPVRWLAAAVGPGGVVLEVTLRDGAGRQIGDTTSVPLPRDLLAGETAELGVELRRPLGPARLVVESRLEGRGAAMRQGDLRWESAI